MTVNGNVFIIWVFFFICSSEGEIKLISRITIIENEKEGEKVESIRAFQVMHIL